MPGNGDFMSHPPLGQGERTPPYRLGNPPGRRVRHREPSPARQDTMTRRFTPEARCGTRMIRLTHDPIDYHALTELVRRPHCGGVVLFLGTVRDLTGDRLTVALDYEA